MDRWIRRYACLPKRSGGRGTYTVYVNPYLVLKSGSYTKHFYIEGQRIVSKLGDGLGDPTNTRKAGEGTVSYGAKQEEAREAIVKNLKFLGQDGAILTAGNSGKTPPGQINGKGKGGGKESEQFQYFYHPDHLGSTSYITDASGEVYQHLEYFAFGETFVEEHSNTHRTPYLFNGKELDEETGLYYYGARYYEPQISILLSVDPLAEKFPYISPYAYGFNNPLKFIDPTGMEGEGVTDPPTEKELDALSEKYAIRASKIESSKSDATRVVQQPRKLNLEPIDYAKDKNQDPNALDPSTLNQNLFDQHYPGGNNPRTFAGDPDYSTQPVNLSGYPAIGHDRRYDNLGVAGAKGLFTDIRAIGADWKFVHEEMQIGNLALKLGDFSTTFKAYALGIGLGAAAIPKTVVQYSKGPVGHFEVMLWFHVSNNGVTNKPSK